MVLLCFGGNKDLEIQYIYFFLQIIANMSNNKYHVVKLVTFKLKR